MAVEEQSETGDSGRDQCPMCIMVDGGTSPCWKMMFGDDSSGGEVLTRGSRHIICLDTAPIVVGHLLIVAIGHVSSMAQAPRTDWPELERSKGVVREALSGTYGAPTFLEHGGASPVRSGGSSVVHAHLHAVPGTYLLSDRLARDFGPVLRFATQAEALIGFGQESYLYCEEPDGTIYGAIVDECPSQYLRRMVADAAGIPIRWDWRYCRDHALEMGLGRDLLSAREAVAPWVGSKARY